MQHRFIHTSKEIRNRFKEVEFICCQKHPDYRRQLCKSSGLHPQVVVVTCRLAAGAAWCLRPSLSVIRAPFEGGVGMNSSHAKQGRNINSKLLVAHPLLSNNINKEEVPLPGETFLTLIPLNVKKKNPAFVFFDTVKAFLHQGMRDKNVSCQGGLLCCTTLWYKKYFIFVSTLDCLQGEHYRSSFRLLLSSFHILLPLSIIFFCCYVLPSPRPRGSVRDPTLTQVEAGVAERKTVTAFESQLVWVVYQEKWPTILV